MSTHLIKNGSDARHIVVGGNSRFTVVSAKTGRRITYRVRKPRKSDNPNLYYVSVRSGPRAGGDGYDFIGSITPTTAFSYSHRSFFGRDDDRIAVFNWLWDRIRANRIPDTIEFWHEGRCARCQRPLTDPESILSGFGPECRQKRLAA